MKIVKPKFASLIVLALIVSVTAVTAVASACDDQAENQKARYEEVQAAITDGDYETWASLMAEADNGRAATMLEAIDADNFYLLGELIEARENYDRDSAQAILEELGLEFPGPRGPHGDAHRGGPFQ